MRTEPLDRVQKAFFQGRYRAPSNAYAAPGLVFASRFKDEVANKLSVAEFRIVEGFWDRQARALSAAKRFELDQSHHQFQEARSALRQSDMSEQGQLLVLTLLDPAAAYYHYQRGDYARARRLVLDGVSANRRLTEVYGVGILSAQRMQLCHNILRITTREEKREETVRLAAAYLNYLEYHTAPLPEAIAWADIVRDFPDEIIPFYFDQVCGEAALALLGTDDTRLFGELAGHANWPGCLTTFAPHGHSWIATAQCKYRGQTEEYLHRACGLLEVGRTGEPSLWLATVFDVAAVCRSLGAPGRALAALIYDEMIGMPDASWIFESLSLAPGAVN
jgi:hypothetical protein